MPDYVIETLSVFRATVGIHPVFGLGLLLGGSWLLGRLAEKHRIPSVTGFILAGMLLGPRVSGLVHGDLYLKMGSITQIAVSVIAVVIGSEFNLARLRHIRRAMATITVMQIGMTFALVTAALALTGAVPLPVAALLGAIATATSPTATVTIVRDMRARGSFIDHLYGAIPLDDAGCLFLFAVVTAVSADLLAPGGATFSGAMLLFTRETAGSLILGLMTGALIKRSTGGREGPNSVYIVSLGLICLMTALAASFHLSPLLSGMAAGAVMANSPGQGRKVIDSLDRLSPPLYAVFFAIAGSELDFSVFREENAVVLGLLYIVARGAGKYGGVWLGSLLARSGRKVRNYLGLAMMPHSGVTIGLLLYIQTQFPGGADYSALMINVVLMGVFVNEIAGPMLSRFAVVRGCEDCAAR